MLLEWFHQSVAENWKFWKCLCSYKGVAFFLFFSSLKLTFFGVCIFDNDVPSMRRKEIIGTEAVAGGDGRVCDAPVAGEVDGCGGGGGITLWRFMSC